MLITDPAYFLPEVLATQLLSTAQNGANRPLFIRGIEDYTFAENDYVLKYRGAERMNEKASARELIAAFIAMTLGIHTPTPVKILVTDDFLKTVSRHSDFKQIQKSIGFNFGSLKMTPNNTIVQNQSFNLEQLHQALQIFVYDLWIQNGDRRFEKPNMFVNQGNIYIIDHELGFGFLDMFSWLRNPTPYKLSELDAAAAKNHFFHATLKQNNTLLKLEPIFQKYALLDDFFWHQVRTFVPTEWQKENEIGDIQAHFNTIHLNSETFKEEIWTKLLK